MSLTEVKASLPDYAKDLRLNLDSVLNESGAPGLSTKQIFLIALASAIGSRHAPLTQAIAEETAKVADAAEIGGAKAAAAIMGMTNIYYRFTHLVSEKDYATLPARLNIEVCCEPHLPPVLADATQMQQIVINLANNAAQAISTGPGNIRIGLDAVTLGAALAGKEPGLRELNSRHPGRLLRLVVSDSGQGMDETTRQRIFEPFFTTKAVNEGTGLGLSVVHGIVQAHHGAITVESAPGTGATFTLYLPANDDAQAAAVESGDGALRPSPQPHNPLGKLHVLYIDDDETLVFLVRRLLERQGYRVSGYTDQNAALAALRADPAAFDLVLSDYNMPGLSGLEVAGEVRALRADLPVAIASGFIDETLRAEAAGAGVLELIPKAESAQAFGEAVQRLAQMVQQKTS